MKICKHCNAEVEDGILVCPECGADMMEDEVTEAPAEETPAAEAPAEETPAAETPAEEPKKKAPWGLIIGLALAAVVVIALIVGKSARDQKTEAPAEGDAVVEEQGTAAPGAETEAFQPAFTGHHTNSQGFPSHTIICRTADDGSRSYFYLDASDAEVAVSPEELDALMDQVIMTLGDLEMTNRDLVYYYDQQMYTFFQTYGSYLQGLLDPTRPLDTQLSMDPQYTWEQFFVTSASELFRQVNAIYLEAQANGHTLTEEEQAMMNIDEQLAQLAEQNGFQDADEMLRVQMNPMADAETYKAYMEKGTLAGSYAAKLMEQIEITDQDLSDYYDAHAEELQAQQRLEKIDKPMVNVRHILIQPEQTTLEDGTTEITEEAWAAAEAKAQELYEQWQAGDATEESFAALAGENTMDPGSMSTGGLYENVFPGQMVPEFNDWCFADGRQTGDHGIVKTDYGYHIMYYVAPTDTIYWQAVVRDMVMSDKIMEQREGLVSKYESTDDLSKAIMVIHEPVAPEAAPEAEAAPAE